MTRRSRRCRTGRRATLVCRVALSTGYCMRAVGRDATCDGIASRNGTKWLRHRVWEKTVGEDGWDWLALQPRHSNSLQYPTPAPAPSLHLVRVPVFPFVHSPLYSIYSMAATSQPIALPTHSNTSDSMMAYNNLSGNPASYRQYLESPLSWRPGSFGSRYYTGCSPSQLLGPLE